MNAILLISCPDTKGITSKISQFIFNHGGNIEHADQHIDRQTNTFFMRIEWCLEGFLLEREQIIPSFKVLADEFHMEWQLYFSDEIPRVAIFVSKELHCLIDLLLRYQAGQFNCHIPLIVSNHRKAQPVAEHFGIDFHYYPITPENKSVQEQKELELLKKEKITVIILARYMQIITERMIQAYPHKIINIHHSFLPAFKGGKPYHQAYRKGVKIIGATSHYVTSELDAGPIIEQDTVRISHRDFIEDLIREGQDLEKLVLSRAMRWHLERKILVYNKKTVIFD